MNEPPTLSETFLVYAPAGERKWRVDQAALDRSLWTLWEAGRTAWAAVDLPPPAFARHLAVHLPADDDAERFVAAVDAGDLYLACACALAVRAALVAFDRSILSQVPAFLSRMDPSPSFADEIRQRVREKLLVAVSGASPRIAEYAGTGPLRNWVRVVVIRTAVSLRRNQDERPAEALDEGLMHALDVELDYLRSRFRSELRTALRAAFAGLPPEQRHVFHLCFAGGMTGDAIAGVLQVTRRTVVRWLASARTAMFHETRRLLQARLRLAPRELDSLIEMTRADPELNVSTLLGLGDDRA